MTFRIQAQLKFATVGDRTAALATIASAISGRGSTVVRSTLIDTGPRSPGLVWEATDLNTGDAGIIYALIQAMTSPQVGSKAYHHTCFHGDNTNLCLKTAEKIWP